MLKRVMFPLLLCAFVSVSSHAQDDYGTWGLGHQENHEQYKDWSNAQTGGSCCNGEDCRPVRARYEDDHWAIWIPELSAWLRVPVQAMQEPDKFHDGRSHACTSKPGNPMMPIPTVYCFSPAQPRF